MISSRDGTVRVFLTEPDFELILLLFLYLLFMVAWQGEIEKANLCDISDFVKGKIFTD